MVTEYSENIQQPEYHDDDDHHIQDLLDFSIHGDIRIDEPQHDTDNDEKN
jgi:hypothetical protein